MVAANRWEPFMHDQDHTLVDLALAVARRELTTTKPLQSPASAAEIYGERVEPERVRLHPVGGDAGVVGC